jgi:SOS-response transcriptional repressor LexA
MNNSQPKRRGRKPVIEPQRKQLILNFIHEYRQIKSVSPNMQEIRRGVGYANAGTVHKLVWQLIDEGWLRCVEPRQERTLVPIYPRDKVYCPIADVGLVAIFERQAGLAILE